MARSWALAILAIGTVSQWGQAAAPRTYDPAYSGLPSGVGDRSTITNAATTSLPQCKRVGIGPRSPVHHQSKFCDPAKCPAGYRPLSARLLEL